MTVLLLDAKFISLDKYPHFHTTGVDKKSANRAPVQIKMFKIFAVANIPLNDKYCILSFFIFLVYDINIQTVAFLTI